jgi:hypothetical protein
VTQPHDEHLRNLSRWRSRPEQDLSLGFLRDYFKREVEKPHQQLAGLGALWAELVPAELASQTRLEGLTRGVLHVAVRHSGALFELDRLLRSGLQRDLITRHRGPALRRVQLRVHDFNAPYDKPSDAARRRPQPDPNTDSI